MKLKSVEVTGFRAFAKTERFDVDADAVIVSGANGRGKTSLFDAILWALTGTIPRLRNEAKNVVSVYSDSGEASVALEFGSDDGTTYDVRRTQSSSDEQQLYVRDVRTRVDGDAARLKLLQDVWPNALFGEHGERSLVDMLTRGIYLQQDLVRQFI